MLPLGATSLTNSGLYTSSLSVKMERTHGWASWQELAMKL
jgi:hypothetical protein